MTDARTPLDSATIAEEDDGIRLDRWFKRHREGTPHALLARWARSGQLTLDGKKADVSDRIATGQKLVMPTPPVETVARPARKERHADSKNGMPAKMAQGAPTAADIHIIIVRVAGPSS